MTHNYKGLKLWQEAMELVVEVYTVTKSFPGDEKFGLTSQMRRAAVSIPSNIAEGAGRNSNKEFARFLAISRGSAFELETQIEIANRLSMISENDNTQLLSKIQYISNMNFKLRDSLLSNLAKEPGADYELDI